MAGLILLYIAGGILLILLAIPLYMGKVKPNLWYGFRVRKTLQNPDAWYAVNRVGAGWMMVSGVLTVLITIALAFVPGLSLDAYATLCAVAFAGVLTVGMVITFRYMDTL
jgi:uncharacterized membrane protein